MIDTEHTTSGSNEDPSFLAITLFIWHGKVVIEEHLPEAYCIAFVSAKPQSVILMQDSREIQRMTRSHLPLSLRNGDSKIACLHDQNKSGFYGGSAFIQPIRAMRKVFIKPWLARKKPALQKSHFCFDNVNRLKKHLTWIRMNDFQIWCFYHAYCCCRISLWLWMRPIERRIQQRLFGSRKLRGKKI